MREGESCFVDLAVQHSTRRLVFLNYAKLHLHELAKGCIYEPSVAAHVILVPRLKTLLTQNTHTFLTLSGIRGGGRGGEVCGSDRPLILTDLPI